MSALSVKAVHPQHGNSGEGPASHEGEGDSIVQLRDARLGSQTRIPRLVRLLPVPLCCVDSQGHIIYSNERFAQVFGYTLLDIPTLEDWWRLAYPDEAYRRWVIQTWDAAVQDAAREHHDIQPTEYRVTCKDGRVRVMVISGITFEDCFLATFVEVTGRKQAEDALQRERALLNTITNATDVMLVYLDRDFNFVSVNPAYAATCQRQPGELIGRNHFALYPNPENEAIFRRARDTGEPVFCKDKAFEFPDQPERGITYWDWSLVPVKDTDGLVTGLVFSLRETTRHKRMELALRESESRHRALFERMEQGVVYQDAEGRITDANPAAARILGMTLDQLRGLSSLDPCWQAIREDGTPFPSDAHPAMVALRTGDPVLNVVMGVRAGDTPGRRWILVDAVPESRSGNGRPRRVFTTFTDITRQRQAQEHRLELERQAQQTRRLESLGVMAGGIAHDFNNILTAILGNAELLLQDLPPGSSTHLNASAIKRASDRAAEICRHMLTYSGQGRYVMEPLRLNELTRDAVELLRGSMSHDVRVELELAGQLPLFRGDAGHIRQVILSLIHNAAEAIGDLPGVIRLTVGDGHCAAAYLNENWPHKPLPAGDYVWLEVADTGCGMNAEAMRHVFEPFFTTKFMGRGLGLPAVMGIVRGHNGVIKVQSEPGRGTTVRVLFPVMAAA